MIPFEAADDLPELLALRLLGGGAEESAGGLVDKADLAGFIEEEDAFAECFEDLLEEAFFPDEAGEERLHFAGFDLVDPGENFFKDGVFHDERIARCLMPESF